MTHFHRLILIPLLWFAAAQAAFAQSAAFRYELLQLLPDDFAVCVVMNDLSGHSARWAKSDWLKRFAKSTVGKNLLETPELKQLEQWHADLAKHLNLDLPTLRDDILGDTVIMSYSPGPKDRPDDERGLFLLHVRSPEKLQKFINKLNDAQTQSGELKTLKPLQHQGVTYWRRVEAKKTQYYCLKDSLFLFTVKEDLLKGVLDRQRTPPKNSPWAKRFEKAGAENAIVTLCVNPRTLDAEVAPNAKSNDPLPSYWRALDAILVTLTVKDAAELRISVQAKADRLPKWASPAFADTIASSSLWHAFPEKSIVTIASLTDFAGTFEGLKLLMPEDERKKATKNLGSIGAFLELDLFKEVLPNIGPDWGVCMLPSKDETQVPVVVFALAVKPGSKEKPVDQALFKSVDFFAKLARLQHPDAISMETVTQGDVEVKFLKSNTLFPPGFKPACALKEGFLLFATTPDAIAGFRVRPPPSVEAKESMLVRISTPELAKLLQHRRADVLNKLTDRQQMTRKEAERNLENVLSVLDLFNHLTLSHQGGNGQASWIVRLTPR